MKVGFISDLHIDRNFEIPAEFYLKTLLDVVAEQHLQVLVIGGDISNHYATTIKFIETLQKQAEIPVYFIPGNHDFWEEKEAKKDTRGIYRLYKEHPQSLIESPVQLTDNFTLVGHPAWYNHAVYDEKQFTSDEVEHGKFRWAYWQDKLRMDWQMTDEDVSQYFSQIIQKDLEQVTTENIILQTHVVTVPEFTMPMPHRIFDFFNAYLATDDLKDFHKKYPITHEVMGHVHFRGDFMKDETRFITNSLGYRREWRGESLYKEMKDSLFILDLSKNKA
jgi:putative phosphoesterase